MTAEEKAKAFLDFVGRNHEKLRKNLAKNVSYDRELFENTFQDTVIRVHDAILRNDPEIADFEKYFFMASRKWYMTLSERMRRHRENKLGLDREIADTGTGDETLGATIEEVGGVIEEIFGQKASRLFIDYFKEKSRGRMSYERYGRNNGIPYWEVKDVVMRIKKHLRTRHPGGMTSEEALRKRAEAAERKIREKFGDGIHREEEKGGEEKK